MITIQATVTRTTIQTIDGPLPARYGPGQELKAFARLACGLRSAIDIFVVNDRAYLDRSDAETAMIRGDAPQLPTSWPGASKVPLPTPKRWRSNSELQDIVNGLKGLGMAVAEARLLASRCPASVQGAGNGIAWALRNR